MIYLIGGPPKCGKTTLAKKLSKELGVSWVSTDSLQCIVREYIDPESDKEKFPSSHSRMKNNDEKYATYSAKEIIAAYRKQAETTFAGIMGFIASEVADVNDHIIEGYHLEPKIVAQMMAEYPNEVRSVFLFKSDELRFISDIKKSTTPHDWIIARTHQEETYPKIAHMIGEYGKIIEMEAIKYECNYFCMDNNFESQIQVAIQSLLNNNAAK